MRTVVQVVLPAAEVAKAKEHEHSVATPVNLLTALHDLRPRSMERHSLGNSTNKSLLCAVHETAAMQRGVRRTFWAKRSAALVLATVVTTPVYIGYFCAVALYARPTATSGPLIRLIAWRTTIAAGALLN